MSLPELDAEVFCPACNSQGLTILHEERGIPTNSCLLLPSLDEAQGYPRGDLRLGYCPACGFLTNTAFDKGLSEYSERYEETQAFSPTFVEFGKDLAQRWVDKYDLAGKTVMEIGCGKGEFLVWMVEAGAGHGIGIDPGTHPERIDPALSERLTWITDFYDERYSELKAEAIVCRHTLEHIPDVAAFMSTVRRAIGDDTDTVVLFELPDAKRVLDEVAFWDVYYEHCSYFSAGSLARLFRATGFEVTHLELDYDDQYLIIEAMPKAVPAPGEPFALEDDLDHLAEAVARFSPAHHALLDEWAEKLEAVAASGRTSVIWGSGSKGVSFLTNLAATGRDAAGLVAGAVDINPHKHGMFMAGSGHEIIAPERLISLDPALVVVMNPVYLDEIRADLVAMGLDPDVQAV